MVQGIHSPILDTSRSKDYITQQHATKQRQRYVHGQETITHSEERESSSEGRV